MHSTTLLPSQGKGTEHKGKGQDKGAAVDKGAGKGDEHKGKGQDKGAEVDQGAGKGDEDKGKGEGKEKGKWTGWPHVHTRVCNRCGQRAYWRKGVCFNCDYT